MDREAVQAFGGERMEPGADNWAQQLQRDGYCIIPDLLPHDTIEQLHEDLRERLVRTPFSQGGFHGELSKRCGSLLRRSAQTQHLVMQPLVLEIAERALGPFCDCLQLNLTQAIQLHPGAEAQPPHRDHDLWRAPKGGMEFQLNVMWPLVRFTPENGATMIWPGSHRRLGDYLLDPADAIAPVMEPGTALLFLGSVLHAGGANRSNRTRTGVIVSYCLGWLKPYENQWLAYPPEIARHFPPELAALVGYRQHRPNLGNYEGQSPAVLLQEDRPDYLGAIDALAPEHVAMIEMYRSGALRAAA